MRNFLVVLIVLTCMFEASCTSATNRVVMDAGIRPKFSKLENSIIFTAQIDGKARMVEYNLTTNEAAEIRPPLPREDDFRHPAYSPDFKKIAFVWSKAKERSAKICIMNRDGSGFEELTQAGPNDGAPFFSPKGNLIGFIRTNSEVRTGFWLAVCDLTTKKVQEFVKTGAYAIHSPTFSSDGSKIAYSDDFEYASGWNMRLVTLKVSTGETTTLVEEKRELVPSYVPGTDDMVYLGSDLSDAVASRPIRERPVEKRGFFSFSSGDTAFGFIKKVNYNVYYLSVSQDGKKALYQNIQDIGVFNLESKVDTKYVLDRDAILKAVLANDTPK